MSFGIFSVSSCYSYAHNVRQPSKESHSMALINQANSTPVRTKCIQVYRYLRMDSPKPLLRADCLIIVIMLNRFHCLLAHTMECRTFSWAIGET